MEKLKGLAKSRKFWAAVVAVLVLVVKAFVPDLPVEADQLTNFVYVIIAYILGVALEDGLRARNETPVLPTDLK